MRRFRVPQARLRELIHEDRAASSFIVSHELPLEPAPDPYKHFDARKNGWTKVVLHPGVSSAREPRARKTAGKAQTRRRPSRPERVAAE